MTKPSIDMLKIGISALKKNNKKVEKWQKTFDEMFNGHFVPTYDEVLATAIIKMLEVAYDDKDEVISWWIYEQDFGLKCKDEPAMWDNNHNPIHLRNIEELYNYLVKNNIKSNKPKYEDFDIKDLSLDDLIKEDINKKIYEEDINKKIYDAFIFNNKPRVIFGDKKSTSDKIDDIEDILFRFIKL